MNWFYEAHYTDEDGNVTDRCSGSFRADDHAAAETIARHLATAQMDDGEWSYRRLTVTYLGPQARTGRVDTILQ